MNTPPVRGRCGGGVSPLLLLLLLLLADLGYAEQEHPHRHAHNGSAPAEARGRRTHQQEQRLQQLQWAQEANGLELGNGYHHLRHEQHLRAELAAGSTGNGNGNGNRQPPEPLLLSGPGEQHHLRHHNRHHAAWQQRVFPELHRQPKTTTAPAGTTTSTAAPLVTDAPLPHVAANGSHASTKRFFDRDGIYPAWTRPRSTRAPNWQQQLVDSDEDDSDDDDDEDDDEDMDEDYEDDELDGADDAVNVAAELAKQMPRYSFFSQKLPDLSASDQDYEDDQPDAAVAADTNRYPSVSAGHEKPAAKRNIFSWFYKPNKEKQPAPAKTTARPTAAAPKSHEPLFSSEEWNKIKREHHLKQQQHQRELQALRDIIRSNNDPLIRGSRAGIDNEDADNNYSARNRIVGSLTAYKQKQLGTPEAVRNARREKEEASAKARAHMDEVRREHTCHLPQKRCLSSGRDPSKIYTPHCTFVHRCSEDSGCCPSRTEICAPKRTHIIERYFYVKGHRDRQVLTERLTFVNHTECHCIERSNYHAEPLVSINGEELPRLSAVLSCNCPLHFERILQNDGQCRCDCSSNNLDCDYRKQGTEHFSLEDRKCIKEGRCKQPTCQFGEYMEKYGSCPKPHGQPSHQMPNYNAVGMS